MKKSPYLLFVYCLTGLAALALVWFLVQVSGCGKATAGPVPVNPGKGEVKPIAVNDTTSLSPLRKGGPPSDSVYALAITNVKEVGYLLRIAADKEGSTQEEREAAVQKLLSFFEDPRRSFIEIIIPATGEKKSFTAHQYFYDYLLAQTDRSWLIEWKVFEQLPSYTLAGDGKYIGKVEIDQYLTRSERRNGEWKLAMNDETRKSAEIIFQMEKRNGQWQALIGNIEAKSCKLQPLLAN